MKTVLASAAASAAVVALSVPAMVSFVTLQATSPGMAEVGNSNITGTAVAGKVRVGTTIAGGALLRVEDASGSGGVYSKSGGNGLYSESTGLTGPLIGGQFVARSTGGRGVIGSATATSGATRGGIFDSKSTTGVGVYGLSSATTGSGVGVYGAATSATGTAIVASNPNASERAELGGPNGALYVPSGTVTKNYGAGPVGAVPIAYGTVNTDGTIHSAGTGNWTPSRTGLGTYTLTVTGENVTFSDYPMTATIAFGGMIGISSAGNTMLVDTFDTSGAAADGYFSFVMFKTFPGANYPRIPDHGFKSDFEWERKRPADYARYAAACREAERKSVTLDSTVGRH